MPCLGGGCLTSRRCCFCVKVISARARGARRRILHVLRGVAGKTRRLQRGTGVPGGADRQPCAAPDPLEPRRRLQTHLACHEAVSGGARIIADSAFRANVTLVACRTRGCWRPGEICPKSEKSFREKRADQAPIPAENQCTLTGRKARPGTNRLNTRRRSSKSRRRPKVDTRASP